MLHLNVHQCINIKRISLVTSITCLKHLTFLDISECDQIREHDIARIAKKLKVLEYFNVRDTKSLHVETVITVCNSLPRLSQFMFCPLVFATDTSHWADIYMEHPTLQICPAGLEIILEKKPHLL